MHKISFKAFDDALGAEMIICFICLRLYVYSVEKHKNKQPYDLWKVFFFLTYLLLFAPKAPRLIKGAHNNTVISPTHKSDRHKQHTKLQQLN